MANNLMRFTVEPVGFDRLNIREEGNTSSAIMGSVNRDFLVDKISGADNDEWWKIRDVSSGIQGFVRKIHLKGVSTAQPVDIPLEQFLDELESNARAAGGNTIWLLAVAHAQSGIKNDRDNVSERVGPFRFSEDNWKALVEANPGVDVRTDEIGRWDKQIVIASLAFGHYRKALKAALEPVEPNALQLYTAHVLGTDAASVIAKADGTKQLVEVLPEAGLDQAAIDFAVKLLPDGKTSVADLNQVLSDELQQGINEARKLLKIPDDAGTLGNLSRRFESTGNPAAIAKEPGDKGHSYGLYQINSGGTIQNFIEFLQATDMQAFANKLVAAGGQGAAHIGTDEFKNAWRELAGQDDFNKAQHEFIKEKFFEKCAAQLKANNVLDALSRSIVVQDVVWSTSVQLGVPLAVNAFKQAKEMAGDAKWVDDSKLIEHVYAERRKFETYFPSSTSAWDALAMRFAAEEQDALAMLNA